MKVKTQSKKVNKSWLIGLLKPGMVVVDLGSAPGAWSQYLRRRMAPEGAAAGELGATLIALDILPMEPIEGVHFLQGDFREPEVLQQLNLCLDGKVVDVVVSDMAPNLSGVESADAARMSHLVELAVEFCQAHMKPQGALVVKVFHGSGYSQLVKLFKETF
ncbi:MAG: RlmE family RNA methyltransferase, partial [Betaproteobacteria bacterium]|nr:RlmE family RNA methyltransferase [Betaproteobacteria bacterium]